jgi:uncharacterized membrane protein
VLGGYWACKYSDHGFEIYLLGNVLYIAMSAIGIAGRARRLKKRFWEFHHVDWMAVAGATVVYWFLYVPPMR